MSLQPLEVPFQLEFAGISRRDSSHQFDSVQKKISSVQKKNSVSGGSSCLWIPIDGFGQNLYVYAWPLYASGERGSGAIRKRKKWIPV